MPQTLAMISIHDDHWASSQDPQKSRKSICHACWSRRSLPRAKIPLATSSGTTSLERRHKQGDLRRVRLDPRRFSPERTMCVVITTLRRCRRSRDRLRPRKIYSRISLRVRPGLSTYTATSSARSPCMRLSVEDLAISSFFDGCSMPLSRLTLRVATEASGLGVTAITAQFQE